MTTNNSKLETRTVTALVNDKPGVLNRITSMLRRRGYNIQSLAVGHSEVDDLSRLTVIVEGGDDVVEKVTKQLHKLIDVIKVNDISDDNIVSRELALMKVKSTPETRSEIVQLVSIYRAKIIDEQTTYHNFNQKAKNISMGNLLIQLFEITKQFTFTVEY